MENGSQFITSDESRDLYTKSRSKPIYFAKLKKDVDVVVGEIRCDVIFLLDNLLYFYKYKKTRSKTASMGYIPYDNRIVAFNSFQTLLRKLDIDDGLHINRYSKRFVAESPGNEIATKLGLLANGYSNSIEQAELYTLYAVNETGEPIKRSRIKPKETTKNGMGYTFFASSTVDNDTHKLEKDSENMNLHNQTENENRLNYLNEDRYKKEEEPPFFSSQASKLAEAVVVEEANKPVEEEPISSITIQVLKTKPEVIRTIETETDGIMLITNRNELLIDMSKVVEIDILKTIYIATYALLDNNEPVKLVDYLEKISAILTILLPKHAKILYKE